jgi:hypothetical protein
MHEREEISFAMYLALFNSITDIIRVLKKLQARYEELYIIANSDSTENPTE